MQYKKIIFLSFLIVLGFSARAQYVAVQETEMASADTLGIVNIIQDARVDQLLETDQMISAKNPGFTGYRVQIFSGRSTDRERAFEVKHEFNELFPEERAYVVYKAPDFRVRVGNFRSKIESIELYKACLEYFPNCYPVKTRILFTDLIPIQQEVEEVILEEVTE
jgi:hypothetical protein